MDSTNNSGNKKLFEKTAVENLLKVYFQRIYLKEKLPQMEYALKQVLVNYPKSEDISKVGLKSFYFKKHFCSLLFKYLF